MSVHTATIHWERGTARFTDNRYSREHTWRFDGGVAVVASASPHVVPVPLSREQAVDPEEAFVAALASCHMLWFLSIAAQAGYLVDRYEDHAEGLMGMAANGKLAITTVTLRPRVVFSGARQPSFEAHRGLHESAHAECFLANSVNSEVRVEPETVLRPDGEATG